MIEAWRSSMDEMENEGDWKPEDWIRWRRVELQRNSEMMGDCEKLGKQTLLKSAVPIFKF